MLDPKGFADFGRQVARLRKSVGQFTQITRAELGPALRDALMFLAGKAAVYPAQSAGSTYRRTGLLGRLWTSSSPQVTMGGTTWEARMENAAPYGPKVMGAEQVEVHRGRWKTVDQIVAEGEGTVMAQFITPAGGRIVTRMAG